MKAKKSPSKNPDTEASGAPRIWKISELTRQIRGALEQTFGTIWVEGEISNLRRPESGHLYFTIKDAGAQLAAVMFRNQAANLKFQPLDGLQVVAFGDLTVYEPRGQHQIVCRSILPKGLGALQAQFEALKQKLEAEGLFASERKRPIPRFPEHIGIVTSPTGAAIRDILNIIDRRFPNVHIVINPVRVQGEGAAREIAAAIDEFNALAESGTLPLDVLIITRGGGSFEDLWAFNEEEVARAIARSRIPTVSAVGHEIDFTIADFVADLRAATPSAAAELVVTQRLELIEGIQQLHNRLQRGLRHEISELENRVRLAAGHAVFRQPQALVDRYRQQLDDAIARVRQHAQHQLATTGATLQLRTQALQHFSPATIIEQTRARLGDLDGRHRRASHAILARRHDHCTQLAKRLDALSHKATLKRGYSITRTATGKIVKSRKAVKSADRIRTMVTDGEFDSIVS